MRSFHLFESLSSTKLNKRVVGVKLKKRMLIKHSLFVLTIKVSNLTQIRFKEFTSRGMF